MIRRPKVLIASLLVIAFGVAVLAANRVERAEQIGDELVEATSVLPENEGLLVLVSGTPQLADGGVLIDEEAGLQVSNAVYYDRIPLQKVYVEKQREVVIDKGEDLHSTVDDVTEIEHYVVKEWIYANGERADVIKNYGVTYENPRPVRMNAYHALGDLRVSDFKVSAADISKHITLEQRHFTPDELAQACGSYVTRSELDLRATADSSGNGILTNGDEVGNVRVIFLYDTLEGAEEITVIGRQRGNELVLEEDDLISSAEHVLAGKVSREEFLSSITSEDASSRNIGIGAIALGLVLLLLSLDLGRK